MAEEWILARRPRFEAGEEVVFAVILRETGELIGAMGLVIEGKFRRAELGYWIGRPYWETGTVPKRASGPGIWIPVSGSQSDSRLPFQTQSGIRKGDAEIGHET